MEERFDNEDTSGGSLGASAEDGGRTPTPVAVAPSAPSSPDQGASGSSRADSRPAAAKSKRINSREAKDFIMRWVHQNFSLSATDRAFHDAFTASVGGKQDFAFYGAEKNKAALRIASELERGGWLERARMGIQNRLNGFPTWVYVYTVGRVDWECADGVILAGKKS